MPRGVKIIFDVHFYRVHFNNPSDINQITKYWQHGPGSRRQTNDEKKQSTVISMLKHLSSHKA